MSTSITGTRSTAITSFQSLYYSFRFVRRTCAQITKDIEKLSQNIWALSTEEVKFGRWCIDYVNFHNFSNTLAIIKQKLNEIGVTYFYLGRTNLINIARQTNRNLYLYPKKTGLPRSIGITPSGKVFVFFNRKKVLGDKRVGEGANKVVTFTKPLGSNELYVSASSPENIQEIDMLKKFRGVKRIVQLLDYFFYTNKKGKKKVRMITEYCNEKDLRYAINNKRLTLRDKQLLFHEIIVAVAYMHNKGVVHRDLKPSNILLNRGRDGVLHSVIGDFGAACCTDDESFKQVALTSPFYASKAYLNALYVEKSSKKLALNNSFSLDSWGVASILYELLTGDTLPCNHCEQRRSTRSYTEAARKGPANKNSPYYFIWAFLHNRISLTDAVPKLYRIDWSSVEPVSQMRKFFR